MMAECFEGAERVLDEYIKNDIREISRRCSNRYDVRASVERNESIAGGGPAVISLVVQLQRRQRHAEDDK